MPDPVLYLTSLSSAAIVSALIVLAMAGTRRPVNSARLNRAGAAAIGLGLATGIYLLKLRVAFPTASALDRFLTIVLPAVLVIELVAAVKRVPSWFAWTLRIILAAAIPGVLLYGSVYLGDSSDAWPLDELIATWALSSLLLAFVCGSLHGLAQRSPGVSISLAVSLAAVCAGLTIMMAGYIKGGAAAFALAATIGAVTIATRLISKRPDMAAINSIGVVGLFSLLFIGRFFGRLSTGCAVAILLAPVLCWVVELPMLCRRKTWVVGLLRLLLVAIPLLIVLVLAKRDFDLKFAPLL